MNQWTKIYMTSNFIQSYSFSKKSVLVVRIFIDFPASADESFRGDWNPPWEAVAMTGTTGLDAGNTAASEKGRDVEVQLGDPKNMVMTSWLQILSAKKLQTRSYESRHIWIIWYVYSVRLFWGFYVILIYVHWPVSAKGKFLVVWATSDIPGIPNHQVT